MIVAARYSFNGGADVVAEKYAEHLSEVESAIANIDADVHKAELHPLGWESRRVSCDYSTEYYTDDHVGRSVSRAGFREMDFVKDMLGIEVQFGKYSFMVYNVAAKMTIFRNLDVIDTGIEIVPIKALSESMSSGVSYFEQFVWDLENRGIADIDVPVLILGIDRDGGSRRGRPRTKASEVREQELNYPAEIRSRPGPKPLKH